MASIVIEKPGFLSTVQDLGRFGFQRYGMPVAGAMDAFSLQLANSLVGNPHGAAGIEATLLGPDIRFISGGMAAFCGSGMRGFLNNKHVDAYKSFSVSAGDLLRFEMDRCGCRMYIAFAGGLDVPVVMGSKSTYLRSGTGGFHGRALKEGDEIPLGQAPEKCPIKEIPASLLPDYTKKDPIRIIPGPEIRRLSKEGLISLLTTPYRVGDQSDRMGYRLEGEKINLNNESHDIISSGVCTGTLQLPGNGQPIMLMADHQTTGGYMRMAVVASVDLTRAAQLRAGDSICFAEISINKAQTLFRARNRELACLTNNKPDTSPGSRPPS